MILSDREIWAACQRGDISISPLPPFRSKPWTSTALDLSLDAEIRRWNPIEGYGQLTPISPVLPEFNSDKLIVLHTSLEDCTKGCTIGPHQLLLGWTSERIKFPHTSKIAARVEGKSGLARIGIGIHVTAPTIHAGFGVDPENPKYPGSAIRLEIWNVGPLEIILTKHMPICQLIFEEVHGTPEEGYSGQFAIQGPPKRKINRSKK